MDPQVVVSEYDPLWPIQFEELKALIWPKVEAYALAFEHVGSTSVPELAAKPVIDIDIIIENSSKLPEIVEALSNLGYIHRGNLGIEGREAFKLVDSGRALPKHNLYVCLNNCIALRNHIALRDHLRSNAEDRDEYIRIKRELAVKFPNSLNEYCEGKTTFVLGILHKSGIQNSELEEVRDANIATK
jgi:GrpB-like predicted nucleotidyltransferase (UPF0157 family)